MTKSELELYIAENYHAEPEHLWAQYPDYEVFRHSSNRKWFAIIMSVAKNRIGLEGDDVIDIADFKCDPVMISYLLGTRGFHPAYHMNKSKWITVFLDGSASDETIKNILDMSYDLTDVHKRQKHP
ncbi:MAG: MmcQ/YjbR family DNA-binding protein [Eubacteriales bacterium]|jgi:predicted DNA-binding protein (MmcQ/YjbR family)